MYTPLKMQKRKRRPLLYSEYIFTQYGMCERAEERNRFTLDIIRRVCLKRSLELLPACRICLQTFSFWLEIKEAFVSFSNYTSYQVQSLQATLNTTNNNNTEETRLLCFQLTCHYLSFDFHHYICCSYDC